MRTSIRRTDEAPEKKEEPKRKAAPTKKAATTPKRAAAPVQRRAEAVQRKVPTAAKTGGTKKAPAPNKGPARYGSQRTLYEKNRKKILATQDVCGICGRPVDMSLKYPHPLSPCIDHIIPIDKGGDSRLENLQLAHLTCNRAKSDKLYRERREVSQEDALISNRNLPHSLDWKNFAI